MTHGQRLLAALLALAMMCSMFARLWLYLYLAAR